MDDATRGVDPAVPRCPWCSAVLDSTADPVCPSCGATLTTDGEPQIPGVTTVDAATSARLGKPQKRSRLLQWISGEPGDEVTAPPIRPGSLAPPPDEVRREIRRLELEAHLTNLSAEASAIAADDALEARAANDAAGAAAALKVASDARAVSEALDARSLEGSAVPAEPPEGEPPTA